MRRQIAAANWKMNCTLEQAETLLEDLLQLEHDLSRSRLVILAVPFPYLMLAKDILHGKKGYHIAAQNLHTKAHGAHTGEVSAEMLRSIGIDYVIIGHSERREQFGETHVQLAEKVNIALEYNIKPIFCCGEPFEIREAGKEKEYVAKQIEDSLFQLDDLQMQHFIIAYEPVWAIGTGKTASPEQAQEMHAFIRKILADRYSPEVASLVSVLYGGSVKQSNAASIFHQPDVDGGLVGGASLIAADFSTIIDALKEG
jgi:triosephosphate isomerase